MCYAGGTARPWEVTVSTEHDWRPVYETERDERIGRFDRIACRRCGLEPAEQRCKVCGSMEDEGVVAHGSFGGGTHATGIEPSECQVTTG